MTKLRNQLSIEKILKDTISKLNSDDIKKFTGKSVSHFRKCSDPDDKNHNLYLSDAIKLDLLSLKSQLGSPFLDNISLLMNNEFNKLEKIENISINLLNIGGRIGNLMDTAENALSPNSEDGKEISKNEKNKIFDAILQVERKIAKLKLSIK